MRVAAERSGNSPFGGGALHGWLQILVEQRGKPAATLWRWSSTKVVGTTLIAIRISGSKIKGYLTLRRR